jgi:hypothetical protein
MGDCVGMETLDLVTTAAMDIRNKPFPFPFPFVSVEFM